MANSAANLKALTQISSKSWQSHIIRSEGPKYTAPEEVFNTFEDLKKAALVLGRIDLCNELNSCISLEICQRYAPLLEVLRHLAQDWLEQDISGESSDAAEIELPMDVWVEAMEGLEDPQDFYQSEEDFVEHSDCTSSETEAISSPASEHSHIEVAPIDSSSSAISQKTSREVAIRYVARYPENTMEASGALPHRAIISELKLQLLELPFMKPHSISGITSNCTESVFNKFQHLSRQIWSLEEPQRSQALKAIRDFAGSTIIQLQLSVESLLAQLLPQIDTLSKNAVAFQYEQTSPNKKDINPLQHLPRLMRAEVFAHISASVYRAPLLRDQQPSSTRMSDSWYLKCGEHLLDCGLRGDLTRVWTELSRVFLAQDPCLLSALHDWLETARNSDYHIGSKASELLRHKWPFIEMPLTQDLRPALHIELPQALELYLGQNMEFLFSRRLLEQSWDRVVKGLLEQDSLLEKELASLSRQVFDRIDQLKVISTKKPLFG